MQEHIDIYCTADTMKEIARTFPYLVNSDMATGGGDLPEFIWHTFEETESFRIESCDAEVVPLPVEHGSFFSTGKPFMSLGFRVGGFSYVSDCSAIPDSTTELVRGSDVLVIDGLKWDSHPSHFSIQESREYCRDAFGDDGRPNKVWLTGFTHEVEHTKTTAECEEWGKEHGKGLWVRPAWDGLRLGRDGCAIDS